MRLNYLKQIYTYMIELRFDHVYIESHGNVCRKHGKYNNITFEE